MIEIKNLLLNGTQVLNPTNLFFLFLGYLKYDGDAYKDIERSQIPKFKTTVSYLFIMTIIMLFNADTYFIYYIFDI